MTGSFSKTCTFGGNFLEFEPGRNFKLSIELSLDGFSFVIKEGNTVKALERYSYVRKYGCEEYALNLKDIFEFIDFFKLGFKTARVCWHSGSLVFVPKEVFDPLHKDKYFGFCETRKTKTHIICDQLDEIGCFGLYEIPAEIESVISSFLPEHEIINSASAIIKWYFHSQYIESDSQRIVIQIRESGIDIFWFVENNLQFYNTFRCRVADDYLYFLLYFIEQFGVDSSKTSLIIFGESISKQEFLENASQIFDNIELIKPSYTHIDSTILGTNDYDRFHLLINI